MDLTGAAQTEDTATQLVGRLKETPNSQTTEEASLLTIALPRDVLVSAVLQRTSLIHLFLKMARNVDEAANFVFVQLIEQEPGLYGKRHPAYARQD
jgi:hypothetical protein